MVKAVYKKAVFPVATWPTAESELRRACLCMLEEELKSQMEDWLCQMS